MSLPINRRMAHWAAAAAVVGVDDAALTERIVQAMLANGWPPLPDAAARAYDPLWVYEAGGSGPLYNPGAIGSLWKDTAGTDPVTSLGDLVARMDDLNGAVHVTQATEAMRPMYDPALGGRLVFFGGQCLSSAVNFDPAGATSIHLMAGIRKLSDAAIGYALALMTTTSLFQDGIAYLRAPHAAAAPQMSFVARGVGSQAAPIATAVAAPFSAVLAGFADIATPVARIHVNGTQRDEKTTTLGTGTFMPHLVHIGAQGGAANFFNGHFSAGAIVTGSVPDAHRNAFGAWLMARSGVLL